MVTLALLMLKPRCKFAKITLKLTRPWTRVKKEAKPCPALARTRKLKMGHLLFGGKLPSFLEYKRISLAASETAKG